MGKKLTAVLRRSMYKIEKGEIPEVLNPNAFLINMPLSTRLRWGKDERSAREDGLSRIVDLYEGPEHVALAQKKIEEFAHRREASGLGWVAPERRPEIEAYAKYQGGILFLQQLIEEGTVNVGEFMDSSHLNPRGVSAAVSEIGGCK